MISSYNRSSSDNIYTGSLRASYSCLVELQDLSIYGSLRGSILCKFFFYSNSIIALPCPSHFDPLLYISDLKGYQCHCVRH